ncbi:sarcoplasmic/endoplasmic reticulum calcium ATPase regulator DWORF-like [Scyliorhinus canicula]|nr:sarcoplasmic/endoplasmic reticulum calcium ATPase regulator DWORF-like [Scyliorhinus canicula]
MGNVIPDRMSDCGLIFSLSADQRYVVPVLLLLGWIVGCSVVVYYVFS